MFWRTLAFKEKVLEIHRRQTEQQQPEVSQHSVTAIQSATFSFSIFSECGTV